MVGLDLNPGMLARARASAVPEGAAGMAGRRRWSIAIQCGNLRRRLLPARTPVFSRPSASCSQMYRVLKPAGRLVVLVWRALAHSPASRRSRRL